MISNSRRYPGLNNPVTVIFFILASFLLFISCEENPARSKSDEGHPITIGFTLDIGDHELLRYFRRELVLDPEGVFPDYVRDDSLLVFHMENIDPETMRSEEITIRWLDNDEKKFSIPEWSDPEGEFFLGFDIFEPGSRSDHLPEEERPIDIIYDKDASSWKFQLQMLRSGITDLRIRLVHGDHNDMVPVPFTVMVDLDSMNPGHAE